MLVEKVENHWKISKCLKIVYDFKNIILDIHRKELYVICGYVCMWFYSMWGPILPLRHWDLSQEPFIVYYFTQSSSCSVKWSFILFMERQFSFNVIKYLYLWMDFLLIILFHVTQWYFAVKKICWCKIKSTMFMFHAFIFVIYFH